jgi:hypothetical protein
MRARPCLVTLSFLNYLRGFLVVSDPDKFGMSQMIRSGPFHKLNLCENLRSHPNTFLHLPRSEALTPPAGGRFGKVGMGPQCVPQCGGPRSRRADGFPATHLVEYSAALRALDDVRCQTHQFVRLNLVAAERAGKREVEVGLAFEPRRHHPTRPSAERTGFRIIKCESRPRKTSDGR